MTDKNTQDQKNNTTASENKFISGIKNVFATLWRWTKRMIVGPSKELSEMDVMAVENLESPSKMAVKTFFRRKLAVVALVVLISLFLFVFIGSIFIPMNANYTDTLQANIAPNFNMLKIPKELAKNVRDINGFSNFTVGVSNDNTLYIWGNTKDALTKKDLSDFPESIREGSV